MPDLKDLFMDFLAEMVEETEAKPNFHTRGEHNPYKKALNNLRNWRDPITQPSDAKRVLWIGPGIEKQLAQRYEDYKNNGNVPQTSSKSKGRNGKSTTAENYTGGTDFSFSGSALENNPFIRAGGSGRLPSSSRAPAPKPRGRPPKRPQPDDEDDLPPPKRSNTSSSSAGGWAGLDDPQAYALPSGDIYGGRGGASNNVPAPPAPAVRSAFPAFWYLSEDDGRVRSCDDAQLLINPPFIMYKVEVLSAPTLPNEFRPYKLASANEWRKSASKIMWLEQNDITRLNLQECVGFSDRPAPLPTAAARPSNARAAASSSAPARPIPPKDDLASLLAQEKRSKVRTLDPTRTIISRTDASVSQDAVPVLGPRFSANAPSSDFSSEPDFLSDPVVARRAAAAAALRRQQQQAGSSSSVGGARADIPAPAVPIPAPKPARTVSMQTPATQASTSRSAEVPAPARTFSAPAGPSHPAVVLPTPLSTLANARTSFEHFEPRIIQADSYQIVLILDNREVKQQHERNMIQTGLVNNHVLVEQRALAVGDVLWIARTRAGEEVVLNWMIERKRLDDLCGSIKNGRFHEQKFRMHRSALSHLIYLVESFHEETHRRNFELQINTSLSSTQVVDDFIVKQTSSLRDTINFLFVMHETITKTMRARDLHVIPSRYISRPTFLDLQAHLQETRPQVDHFTSYDDFSALNKKSATHTVEEAWARMLLCVKSCSAERTAFILEHFPSPHDMWEACKQAQEIEDASRQAQLIESQSQSLDSSQSSRGKGKAKKPKITLAKHFLTELGGDHRRKVGEALSEKIWEVMMGEYSYEN